LSELPRSCTTEKDVIMCMFTIFFFILKQMKENIYIYIYTKKKKKKKLKIYLGGKTKNARSIKLKFKKVGLVNKEILWGAKCI
jgi:hypothetical protein